MFENLRKKLDSIVSSNPGHFLTEMNEIEDDTIFDQSEEKRDGLFEIVDLEPQTKATAAPETRKMTFVKRIPNGKFLSDPARLERGQTEDLTERAVWARVGNGRVKIFPLSFGKWFSVV